MTHTQLWLQNFLAYSTYVTSSILVMLTIFTLYKVRSGSKFEFLYIVVLGLMVSNLAYICYMMCYTRRSALESDPTKTKDELFNIVTISIMFDTIRYLSWQVTIWIFAFKYWVISIEFPKAIRRKRLMSLADNQEELIREDPNPSQTNNEF
jgi:hypothetical protein